jgi:SAM-dependent methyltransferase
MASVYPQNGRISPTVGLPRVSSDYGVKLLKMFVHDPDRDWHRCGESNPYFWVLTEPKFLDANLNEDSLQEFFVSGERHVEHVYREIRSGMRPDFQPARVLDYGCGVGRLVVAFAGHADKVVGVDISQGMLERARENCNRFGANSVSLVHVNDLDTLAPASFDLIHSYIVFQHIPVARGELILRKLISLIAEGGMGAIHLNYSDSRSAFRRGVSVLRQRVGLAHGLMNLIQRKRFSTPLVQMNVYSMDRIFDILIDMHCSNLHVEFWEHRSFRGAMLYFERSSKPHL